MAFEVRIAAETSVPFATPDAEGCVEDGSRGAKACRYLDRDLSDLAYVRRIAARGADSDVPLYERLRFLEIAQSVLDEFVAVRLSSIDGGRRAAIEMDIAALRGELAEALDPLYAQLSQSGLSLARTTEAIRAVGAAVHNVAERELLPGLTPLTVDAEHPFPELRHGQRALVLALASVDGEQLAPLIVPLSDSLPFHVRLEKNVWARSDLVLRECMDRLLPRRVVAEVALLRVLRLNDLSLADEIVSLRDEVEQGLVRRPRNPVVCVEFDEAVSQFLADFVSTELRVLSNSFQPSVLRLPRAAIAAPKGLRQLAERETKVPRGHYPLMQPQKLPALDAHAGDLFAAMRDRDLMLHSPYQDFAALQALLWQAARDPAVVAVRQTLYRTDHGVVEPLLEAAAQGKDVTVVVEIEARENERENIALSHALERAGAHIVHGIVGLKVHAKLLHIVRRENGGLREYAVFSTGNFHPGNAAAYADLTLFTAEPLIAAELRGLLNYITGHLPAPDTQLLAVAPATLRSRLVAMIRCESENARAGLPSGIWFKVNSLLDHAVIDALYEASAAGVPIHGSVRRHCALIPGVPGLSENIRIHSLIGRFLEHARVACFANGSEMSAQSAEVFIASADWMPRNFDERVEVLVPIRDPELRRMLVEDYRQAYLDDERDSWQLDADGRYTRLDATGRSAQQDFTACNASDGRIMAPGL